MHLCPTPPGEIARAPRPFSAALSELVQIGMSVARLVGCTAEAETALVRQDAAAMMAGDVSPMATSLAEAIAADQATALAAQARQAALARTEAVAASFAQVSRAIRRTILLAERMDRAWAAPTSPDIRHAMVRGQIARGVTDAIADAGRRAQYLTEALAERLDSLDTLDDVTSRPAGDIVREICRDLGLDPARMPPPAPGGSISEAALAKMETRGSALHKLPTGCNPPARASPASA